MINPADTEGQLLSIRSLIYQLALERAMDGENQDLKHEVERHSLSWGIFRDADTVWIFLLHTLDSY